MNKIFTYLDKAKTYRANLVTIAMNIYKVRIFIPLKEKLYEKVNKMINEDRNNKVIIRFDIKSILNIFDEGDMYKQAIIKENNKIYWTGEHRYRIFVDWF